MEFRIIPLEARHIKDVVNLHIRAFEGFFLSSLGPTFLKLYYESFLNNSNGVALVAENKKNEKPIGIIIGQIDPETFFRELFIKKWWVFGLAAVPAILRKPRIIFRIIRAAWFRGNAPKGPDRAYLASICVDPAEQRHGIGRALVENWVKEIEKTAIRGCYLTTDANENEIINAFYQRSGWTIETTFTTPQGRQMHRYVKDFK
ncbi:MAG: GNAT family N-acetyltransferase [Planctomycetota bacterium]